MSKKMEIKCLTCGMRLKSKTDDCGCSLGKGLDDKFSEVSKGIDEVVCNFSMRKMHSFTEDELNYLVDAITNHIFDKVLCFF